MYNVHTCDYATCPHFHHPLWDTFATSFQLSLYKSNDKVVNDNDQQWLVDSTIK